MKSLANDSFFDLILSVKGLIKATAFSFALIELKLILDQRKKIDDFENTLECVENLFQELQIRDDIPTDIKHKIDSLSNNKSERGD